MSFLKIDVLKKKVRHLHFYQTAHPQPMKTYPCKHGCYSILIKYLGVIPILIFPCISIKTIFVNHATWLFKFFDNLIHVCKYCNHIDLSLRSFNLSHLNWYPPFFPVSLPSYFMSIWCIPFSLIGIVCMSMGWGLLYIIVYGQFTSRKWLPLQATIKCL